MSTQSILADTRTAADNSEQIHKLVLGLCYALALTLVIGVLLYGVDYYLVSTLQRPYSAKHHLLRPSGPIGIKLGILGLSMFGIIFLYPLRKRWKWFQSKGNSRHWLDFHVLLGIFAPIVIALHASFKFQGIAGMAFWLMLSVALSGIVGRYLYGQIPRRVNSAELSLKDAEELQGRLVEKLSTQMILSPRKLERLFRLPSEKQVSRWPMVVCLVYMIWLDWLKIFRIAQIRMSQLSFAEKIATLGGLLSTNHRDLEAAISVARERAALSKRILFLSRAQQVFHLWHVVHKPFSYSFAVLAILHIAVVYYLGFV